MQDLRQFKETVFIITYRKKADLLDRRCIRSENEIHRAGWIMISPNKFIPNGYIRVENGIIRETGRYHDSVNAKDHGPGVIMPGLVNAHTHLELSRLKGKLDFDLGFQAWVQNLLQLRQGFSNDELKTGAKQGIKELQDSGSCAVGDISTLGLAWDSLCKSGLSGTWFREYLGTQVHHDFFPGKSKNLKASFAGHAPHTTSPALLKHLSQAAQKQGAPFSIHVGESQDEIEFLETGKGRWADFLLERGIDFSDWGLPGQSPVKYIDSMGILNKNTLLVHLIHSQKHDFQIIKSRGSNVCVCPRSNFNLHKQLPDLEQMLKIGINPCLGTDSLASTRTLNIFDEMRFTAIKYPDIKPGAILEMSTINGAKALGISRNFGTLEPGKDAVFIYLPITADNQQDLLEKIIHDNS